MRTGAEADGWRAERLAALDSVAALVRSTPLEAAARVEALQAELSDSRRRLAEVERQASSGSAAGLAEQAQDVGGVSVVVGRVDAKSADALREAGDEVKRQLGSGVVVLGAVPDDRPLFVAMVTPDLAESGLLALARNRSQRRTRGQNETQAEHAPDAHEHSPLDLAEILRAGGAPACRI